MQINGNNDTYNLLAGAMHREGKKKTAGRIGLGCHGAGEFLRLAMVYAKKRKVVHHKKERRTKKRGCWTASRRVRERQPSDFIGTKNRLEWRLPRTHHPSSQRPPGPTS